VLQKVLVLIGFIEAGIATCMADGTRRACLYEYGVLVAICFYSLDSEVVTGSFAFCPKAFFAAAVKGDTSLSRGGYRRLWRSRVIGDW